MGEIMKKILFLLVFISGILFSASPYMDIEGPAYLVVNANNGFELNGIPLGMLTKKGRDSEARIYKLTGYKVSGKVSAAEKLYSYFLEYTSKQEVFEEELNKISELSKSEKETILNSMSKSFTSKWKDNGVKVIVSDSKNKKSLELYESFNAKEFNHLAACDMLNEGANLEDCQYGIYANLNSSDTLVRQRLGRLLRHPEPILIIPYYVNTRDEELKDQMLLKYNAQEIKIISNINEIELC